MADINSSKRSSVGLLSRGLDVPMRYITFDVDFANDFTMTAVADEIQLGVLPKGTTVFGGHIIQKVAGTGTGTQKLTLDDGSQTDVTSTLASTDAAGTVEVNALATTYTCDADTEVVLVNATAVRTDGKAQIVLYVAEGVPTTFPVSVDRDVLA
jgi:hypothetical protein